MVRLHSSVHFEGDQWPPVHLQSVAHNGAVLRHKRLDDGILCG